MTPGPGPGPDPDRTPEDRDSQLQRRLEEIKRDLDEQVFAKQQFDDIINAESGRSGPLTPMERQFRKSLIWGSIAILLVILGGYQAIQIALAVTSWLFS